MGRLSRNVLIYICVLGVILVLVVVNYKMRTGTEPRNQGAAREELKKDPVTLVSTRLSKPPLLPKSFVDDVKNESGAVGRRKPALPFVPLTEDTANVRNESGAVGRSKPTLPFVPLTEDTVDGVKKFVFFFGWSATGSSIIGSLMDAHPHMIIPHEYGLFGKWAENPDKYYHERMFLYNELYKLSYDNRGLRKNNEKSTSQRGYSFGLDGWWQGQYNDSVAVIGDKRAGPTTRMYKSNPAKFQEIYNQLTETVKTPVFGLFIVRNPYDVVAKAVVQHTAHTQNMVQLQESQAVYRNDDLLNHWISGLLSLSEANHAMIHDPRLNLTVLEVHNADYVENPKETMQRICDFVKVECSNEYLQSCEDKAFKSTFKTRELLEWPPELRSKMEQGMRKYRFFDRYSFDS